MGFLTGSVRPAAVDNSPAEEFPIVGYLRGIPMSVSTHTRRNGCSLWDSGRINCLQGFHLWDCPRYALVVLWAARRNAGMSTGIPYNVAVWHRSIAFLSHLIGWYTVTNRSGSLQTWITWQEKRLMPAMPTSKAHSYSSKASRLISSARPFRRFISRRNPDRSAFSSARCSAR